MTYPSALQELHEAADAQFMTFGEIAIVAMHDVVETEYGRLRAAAAVMDCPHRSLLQISGADRLDFLHRLLTRDLASAKVGDALRAMLLTNKGQIMADLIVLVREDRLLIDVDAVDAPGLLDELEKLHFSEDITLTDVTDQKHRLSIHGPAWAKFVIAPCGDLAHRQCTETQLFNRPCIAYRLDQCDVPGVHVWLDANQAKDVWMQLTDAEAESRARPLGWLAFNMARIEAGTPLYHIDFGPDSLPGEARIDMDVVSGTKGCYRGQETVATMRDRGHPAKLLVAFQSQTDALPTAGTPIYESDAPDAKTIGAVTSSTISPLKGGAPIGIAMVKWGQHEPGTTLWAPAEGAKIAITINDLD